MANWKVLELERKSEDGLVTVVHWEATLSEQVSIGEENTKKYSSRVYGSISLSKGEEFIPFEELTQETVINWVKNCLGQEEVNRLEDILQEQINNQKNPPILKGVPWQNS
jgi:hypothetical protein